MLKQNGLMYNLKWVNINKETYHITKEIIKNKYFP